MDEQVIAQIARFDNQLNILFADTWKAVAQRRVPEGGHREKGHLEDEHAERDNGQYHEPKPQEQEYLLVDDVHGQHAEDGLALDLARGAEVPIGAAGHLREDPHQRIDH